MEITQCEKCGIAQPSSEIVDEAGLLVCASGCKVEAWSSGEDEDFEPSSGDRCEDAPCCGCCDY